MTNFLQDLSSNGVLLKTERNTLLRICRHCGEIFETKKGLTGSETAGNQKRAKCFKEECIEADKEYWKAFRKARIAERGDRVSTAGWTNEKLYPCRKCGKKSVNYFHCPSCLHELSKYEGPPDDCWPWPETLNYGDALVSEQSQPPASPDTLRGG